MNSKGTPSNLKRGNTKNVGAKRDVVRLACINGFEKGLPKLLKLLEGDELSPGERVKVMDLLGKYGLGSVQSVEMSGNQGADMVISYTFGPSLPQPSVHEDALDAEFTELPPKRGRGRPKKDRSLDLPKVPKPIGRPRKARRTVSAYSKPPEQ